MAAHPSAVFLTHEQVEKIKRIQLQNTPLPFVGGTPTKSQVISRMVDAYAGNKRR